MLTRDELAEQALALPPEDRAYLADVLECSLTSTDGFATPEIAAAWMDEIAHRLNEYKHGGVQLIDTREAIAEVQKQLALKRAERASS